MQTWIVFLRAIGGSRTLPSKTFVEILEALKLGDARTYIATGNAVFRTRTTNRKKLANGIRDGIHAARGFAPDVLLLTVDELEGAIANNPWREAESEPKSLHLVFLSEVPASPDIAKLESLRTESESFMLKGKVFYVRTPDGAGRSKLFARTEKSLGVWGTARNWRTVCKVRELARSP
ncbi:MAG TPA: DUF1697 domain-containing protein [Gammaproteobacteria bacterium]